MNVSEGESEFAFPFAVDLSVLVALVPSTPFGSFIMLPNVVRFSRASVANMAKHPRKTSFKTTTARKTSFGVSGRSGASMTASSSLLARKASGKSFYSTQPGTLTLLNSGKQLY